MNNISDLKYYYNCVENYKFFIDDEEMNLVKKLYLNSKKIKNKLQRFLNICKQKIYKVLWQAQEYLEKMPSYAGEEEWLEEQKFDDAVNKIKGDFPNRWSD